MNVILFMFNTIFFLPSASSPFTFSRSALLSSPVKRNHHHAVHFALTHFQCHVISSSSESGSGGNHFRSPESYHSLSISGFASINPNTLVSSSPRKTCNSRRRCRPACSAATPVAASTPGKTAKHPRNPFSPLGPPQILRHCCQTPQLR